MPNTKLWTITAVAAALALGGCNAGMEPAGPTPEEIQAKIATLPPDQQISMIQHSPMPKADQEKRIQEIRDKYNLPAPAGAAPAGPDQGRPPSK